MIVFFGSCFGGCDEVWVLPKSISAHAAIEDLDRIEAETRPNFNKCHLFDVVVRGELLFFLVQDLIISEKDLIVEEV